MGFYLFAAIASLSNHRRLAERGQAMPRAGLTLVWPLAIRAARPRRWIDTGGALRNQLPSRG